MAKPQRVHDGRQLPRQKMAAPGSSKVRSLASRTAQQKRRDTSRCAVPSRVTIARSALFEDVRGGRQPTTSAGSLTAVCPGCPLGRSLACGLFGGRGDARMVVPDPSCNKSQLSTHGKPSAHGLSCAAGLLIRQLGCNPTMARGNRRIPGTRRLTRAAAAQRQRPLVCSNWMTETRPNQAVPRETIGGSAVPAHRQPCPRPGPDAKVNR